MLASVSSGIVIVVVIGYLLGSIPVANQVAGRHGGDDLRDVGDRNPGYWNAAEQLGRRAALPVFVGDVAKGMTAAGVGAGLAAGRWWFPVVGTAAAMVGHAWPVFADFRGGRSVLVFVGGAVVISPTTALVATLIAIGLWSVTRRFDWAARAGMFGYPIIQLAVDGPNRTAATGVLMTFIGVRFAQAFLVSRTFAPSTPDDV
jgi:glycerol-3-phosphate acyltransferase PlsY